MAFTQTHVFFNLNNLKKGKWEKWTGLHVVVFLSRRREKKTRLLGTQKPGTHTE